MAKPLRMHCYVVLIVFYELQLLLRRRRQFVSKSRPFLSGASGIESKSISTLWIAVDALNVKIRWKFEQHLSSSILGSLNVLRDLSYHFWMGPLTRSGELFYFSMYVKCWGCFSFFSSILQHFKLVHWRKNWRGSENKALTLSHKIRFFFSPFQSE